MAAIVAGAIAIFALGVAVGAALDFFGVFPHEPPAVITYGPRGEISGATALNEGDCFQGSVSEDLRQFEIGRAVDCDRPHRFEAFGQITAPEPTGGAYDPEAVAWFGDSACYFLFEPYVGVPYDESSLGLVAVVPSRGAWTRGGRDVRCLVFDYAGGTLDSEAQDSGL